MRQLPALQQRAKKTVEITLETLQKYARHYYESPDHNFCKIVKEAIAYVNKEKGAAKDRSASKIKKALKEDLYGEFEVIRVPLLKILEKEHNPVPGHFIMAFLHAAEAGTDLDGLCKAANKKEGTVATRDSFATNMAEFEAPVEGVGSMLPSTVEEESDSSEESSGEPEGVKLSKLSIETLGCLRAGNYDGQTGYRDITEAGLKRLIQDLEPKGYSYVEKKGKYVIFTPNCGAIGGHDSHAVDIRAGFEGGALMAIASFQSLRASLVRDGIIEDPFAKETAGEEGNELLNHLDESEVEACKAAQTLELQRLVEYELPAPRMTFEQARNLFEKIVAGVHLEIGDVERVPHAYAALGIEIPPLLAGALESHRDGVEEINMRDLQLELTGRLGVLYGTHTVSDTKVTGHTDFPVDQ